ncbi:MAG: glycosyltransferase [Planctomycetota bacterium]
MDECPGDAMRILMLGWEFPPFLAGGLGTACHGLTKALDRLGHEVTFVLPKAVGDNTSHVKLLGPDKVVRPGGATGDAPAEPSVAPVRPDGSNEPTLPSGAAPGEFRNTRFIEVPAGFSSPYGIYGPGGAPPNEGLSESFLDATGGADTLAAIWQGTASPFDPEPHEEHGTIGGGGESGTYGKDLFGDSQRYARLVVSLARNERFDVIHANDWLTYPAGLALRAVSGKPLVAHVHATEFDRSGDHVNQAVYDIERAGMHGADRLVVVSQLTKNICVNRYGVDGSKVDVVYNGVDREGVGPTEGSKIERNDRVVLFLGRITMQKGPEYFIAAAKRVLERMDNVKFLVAGSGDMALRMIEYAAALGIGHKVMFTGFLRGRDVERIFDMADCYVMPSVSEPFGIAALEAIRHDTPVVVSKQSGAAEVLTHALKVDFWDTEEMASKIVSVLKYPALSQTLRDHGEFELRRLTWDGAAERVTQTYHHAAVSRTDA